MLARRNACHHPADQPGEHVVEDGNSSGPLRHPVGAPNRSAPLRAKVAASSR